MATTETTKSIGAPASLELASTGDIAAAAFARFERGIAPDEVVTELVLPVDTVEYLWRTWVRLRGIVPLSAESARALREALRSNRPLANGSDVAAVRQFLERPLKPCSRCKNAAREYCATCPAKEAMRAARGALRGVTKKPRDQNYRAGMGRGTGTVPAGECPDGTSDDEPNGFVEAPCREPGEEPL